MFELLDKLGLATRLAVPPDGRRAVLGSEEGALVMWDLEEGKDNLWLSKRYLLCHNRA